MPLVVVPPKLVQSDSISYKWKECKWKTVNTEPFNCHESLLWEGFVTPILADSSACLFSRMHSENRKLNGSAINIEGVSFPFRLSRADDPKQVEACDHKDAMFSLLIVDG